MPTLYEKALRCAIRDLKFCPNRETANKCFLKWESFHKNVKFKKAVKEKKVQLVNRK